MTPPAIAEHDVTVLLGDVRELLAKMPAKSVNCCVTSPPYFGLRDYGVNGQLGLEETPAEYVTAIAGVFAEVKRVLTDDGTLWLNLGDSYSTPARGSDKGWDKSRLNNPARVQKMQFAAMREGRKIRFDRPTKSLLGIPWRVAFALQDQGWLLRQDIIWSKTNGMPESVTDRPTTNHEYLFQFSKRSRYWYDSAAIREPTGRNAQSVWTMPTQPFPEAHYAVFPPELPRRCIAAGCPADGTVLDPFAGSGTTLAAARQLGRNSIGIELNPKNLEIIRRRIGQTPFDFGEASA